MDPSIVPAGPVADHEVSTGMPIEANHRRHRHPTLLHATEWMKAMYARPVHQGCATQICKSKPEVMDAESQSTQLPSTNIRKPSAKKPRGPSVPKRKASLAARAGKRNAQTAATKLTKPMPAQKLKRGAAFPPIDYGPVGLHTALSSHPPSQKEKKYSSWLSEGWQIWRTTKKPDVNMVSRV